MNQRDVMYLKLLGFFSAKNYGYVNLSGHVANLYQGGECHNPGFMVPTGSYFKVANLEADVLKSIDHISRLYNQATHNDLYVGINYRAEVPFVEVYEWFSPTDREKAIMAAIRYGADRYFKPCNNEKILFSDGKYLRVKLVINDGLGTFKKVTYMNDDEEVSEAVNTSTMVLGASYDNELNNYLKNNDELISKSIQEFQEGLARAK